LQRKHVDECAACRAKIADWKASRALFSPLSMHPRETEEHRTPECPPVESLLHAADLSPSGKHALLLHAATCDFCGSLLRELSTAPELRTGGALWQKGFAREQAARAGRRPVLTRRYAWIGIAASLVVIAGGVLWWSYQRNSRPEILLARAFTVSRPFEYRLPDAGYAAQDARRGAGASSFDSPAELSSAEEEIRRRLAGHPDDTHALTLKGLAELEERDYEAAIDTLNHASDIAAPDTRTLVALGCAYMARGDVEKRPIDYGHALDFLLKAVRQSPQDRAALFNLAIAYEKINLLDEAADTWGKLLALPADGWSAESRGRLENVEKLRRARRRTEGAVLRDPAEFLAHRSSGFRPQRYYEIFWMKWLPLVSVNAAAHEAAALLGTELERQNGDTSIRDAVKQARGGPVSAALAQLGKSMEDIRAGKSDEALAPARSALAVLESHRQSTAAIRIRAEMVYIDGVQARYGDCLRDADLDLARIRGLRYPYITAQLHLDRGSCAFVTDPADARAEYSIAERDLAAHRLWMQRLRAVSFLAFANVVSGKHEVAWQDSISGLGSFWTTDGDLSQAENLQIALETSAEALGWDHAAAALYAAGIRSAAQGGNRSLEATGRMDRSRLLGRVGDTAGEMRELDVAEKLFRSLPAGPETKFRLTYGLMRKAEAEIDSGKPAIALATLNDLSGTPSAAPTLFQAEVEQARGLAYLKQMNFSAAGSGFRRAIAIGESTPSAAAPPESYTGLAQVLLTGGDAAGALAAWQASRPRFAAHHNAGADSPALLIAIAILPRGIAVFSKSQSWCRFRMVAAAPADVERMCRRFVRLCSSPASDLPELHTAARQLYAWLLAPELAGLRSGARIELQTDGWISAIPFPALTPKPFVIERIEGGSPQPAPDETFGPDSPALLVSVPSARAPDGSRLPILSAVRGEVEDVHASLSHAAVLQDDLATPEALRAAVPRAAIFHFAGHGWSDGGNGGLLLTPDSSGEARYLTAYEITSENWSGCRLAVLSACLSATGELRGPVNNQSLVRALLGAGAQRVIAAEWSVDSEATRLLMREFYVELMRGRSAPEALGRARIALSTQARWSHPYYWAAFDVFSR
jgi:CHAT domain-containing protein/cytochrome c-type biogenesis protein CcmH/NrfG